MIHALIVTDNTYGSEHAGVNRGYGAHRIATVLRNNGYKVEVVDYILRWELAEFQHICEQLVGSETLFLGVGGSLFFDSPGLNLKLNWFKLKFPHIPIVLGGSNVICRDTKPVDYVVDGYAEEAILELVKVFKGDKLKKELKFDLSTAGRFINCNKTYANFNTQDLSIKYLPSDFISSDQALGIETARGCIFKCKFCTYPLIGKTKLDYLRDYRSLRDELIRNYANWGTTNYIINEDTLNDSTEKLRALEKVILDLPFSINFVSYARLDLLLSSPSTLDLLLRIGLKAVHFGIETFNPNAAKIIGKSTNIKKIKDGLLWVRERAPNLNIQCGNIVGLPEDTDNHWESLSWYKESGVDFYYFNPLYLTDSTQVINTSDFSRNYRKYGFEIMSNDEIENELLEKMPTTENVMIARNAVFLVHKNKTLKVLPWKNSKTGYNYFSASRLAMELTEHSVDRKIQSWTLFEYVSAGFPISLTKNWNSHLSGKNPIPLTEVEQASNLLISEYKQKKLTFDYKDFYNGSEFLAYI